MKKARKQLFEDYQPRMRGEHFSRRTPESIAALVPMVPLVCLFVFLFIITAGFMQERYLLKTSSSWLYSLVHTQAPSPRDGLSQALIIDIDSMNDRLFSQNQLEASSADAPSADEEAVPVNFTSEIEEILQNPVLPAGCEPVALTCVLRSMGFDLSLTEIADGYLDINYEGDFVYRYSGSPYVTGAGYPPSIVSAANAYLNSQNATYAAQDITGTDFSALLERVEAGYPVLVWTTMYMGEPDFTGIYIDEYEWYSNEHCVVLYGVDGQDVLVSDPLEGLVYRDTDEFARLYETCGSMALVIT